MSMHLVLLEMTDLKLSSFPPHRVIPLSNCTLLEAGIQNDCVLMMDISTEDSILESFNTKADTVSMHNGYL